MNTPYERELERIKAEHSLCHDQDVIAHRIYRDRRKLRSIPKLRPITAQVADLGDRDAWPEINAAIDWCAEQRKAGKL